MQVYVSVCVCVSKCVEDSKRGEICFLLRISKTGDNSRAISNQLSNRHWKKLNTKVSLTFGTPFGAKADFLKF